MIEPLTKQAKALIDKLGPEFLNLINEQVDPSEAKEFMSILSEIDKSCTK
jgi:hypothetical protein